MSDELDYRWRKVSEHGQPDEVTCPWGYRWRNSTMPYGGTVDPADQREDNPFDPCWGGHIEWQPVPPPCDEVMPPPEPKPRWSPTHDGGEWGVTRFDGCATRREAAAAAAVLNAYDRDGAVLRVRDWQESPDDGTRVLRWDGEEWGYSMGKYVRHYRSPWAAMPPGPGEVSDG